MLQAVLSLQSCSLCSGVVILIPPRSLPIFSLFSFSLLFSNIISIHQSLLLRCQSSLNPSYFLLSRHAEGPFDDVAYEAAKEHLKVKATYMHTKFLSELDFEGLRERGRFSWESEVREKYMKRQMWTEWGWEWELMWDRVRGLERVAIEEEEEERGR